MAHPPSEADMGPDREPAAGMPHWVIVFGVITLVVVLLFIVLLLIGGGHSPRRHTSSGDAGGWHMATSLTPLSVHQP